MMDVLNDPLSNPHPLILEVSLKLLAWTVIRKTYIQRGNQRGLPTL